MLRIFSLSSLLPYTILNHWLIGLFQGSSMRRTRIILQWSTWNWRPYGWSTQCTLLFCGLRWKSLYGGSVLWNAVYTIVNSNAMNGEVLRYRLPIWQIFPFIIDSVAVVGLGIWRFFVIRKDLKKIKGNKGSFNFHEPIILSKIKKGSICQWALE